MRTENWSNKNKGNLVPCQYDSECKQMLGKAKLLGEYVELKRNQTKTWKPSDLNKLQAWCDSATRKNGSIASQEISGF